jgi:hypothetical protein
MVMNSFVIPCVTLVRLGDTKNLQLAGFWNTKCNKGNTKGKKELLQIFRASLG